MAAFGAKLITVSAGKMELARDLAHVMQVRRPLPFSPLAQVSAHWHHDSLQLCWHCSASLCMTA